MGLFHCPVGAIMCGDEDCIGCGLCSATTVEEKVKATDVIREWIKEHAHERNKKTYIYKIAICGKGGSGKSTLTALVSGALEEMGYATFIMDTDSSNEGLWKKLGMPEAPKPLNTLDEKNPENAWFEANPMVSTNFVEPYVQNNGNRGLIAIGKISEAMEGDANAMGDYAKEVIRHIVPLDKEIIIADQESGVESFGRGIEILCDMVLILVEPSDESIELAAKIQYMAQGLGIKRIRAVLNKVEDEEQEEYIQERLSDLGVRFLGTISKEKELQNRNMRGLELPKELCYQVANTPVRMMLDEAQMPYQKP